MVVSVHYASLCLWFYFWCSWKNDKSSKTAGIFLFDKNNNCNLHSACFKHICNYCKRFWAKSAHIFFMWKKTRWNSQFVHKNSPKPPSLEETNVLIKIRVTCLIPFVWNISLVHLQDLYSVDFAQNLRAQAITLAKIPPGSETVKRFCTTHNEDRRGKCLRYLLLEINVSRQPQCDRSKTEYWCCQW